MADEIWEHKKGPVWRIVERQTHEIRALHYQNKVLKYRARRAVERAKEKWAG